MTRDEAAAALGSDRAPALLRLPFSHFCRKAEWGLTRCGVAYTTLDVTLPDMRHVRRANPVEKTVPVLAARDRLVHGSHAILRWADGERSPPYPSLYPDDERTEILAWEAWADNHIGAPVRREAYRVLADDPAPYGRSFVQRVRLRLARPVFRRVLVYLKGDQHVDEDRVAVASAIERTVERLRARDSGFLFADHPTGADLATAALLEPVVAIGKVRHYDRLPAWGEFVQYVRSVRPARTTRAEKHRIKPDQWAAFEALNHAQTQLERPTADQTAP